MIPPKRSALNLFYLTKKQAIPLKPAPTLHPKTIMVQLLYHDAFFIWQVALPSRTLHKPEKIRAMFFDRLLCELYAVVSTRSHMAHPRLAEGPEPAEGVVIFYPRFFVKKCKDSVQKLFYYIL